MAELASNVPEGWLRTALGKVTEERSDRVGTSEAPRVFSSTKHHGLVPSDEYFKGRTIYSSNLALYKKVARNWFAYATNHLAEGSIGIQDKFDVGCVSPIYTVFSCKENVHPHFLWRVLKSPPTLAAYKLHEQASVDRRGAVRYRDFATVGVTLPSLSEQQRIVEILDSVDESIRCTTQLIAKLITVAEGAVESLFEGLWRTHNSLRTLGSLGYVSSGSTPSRSHHARYFAGGKVAWVKTLDLNEGVVTSTEEYITEAAIADCSCPLLSPGTVLVAMYGGWAQIGRTGVLGVAASINQAISAIELKDPQVEPLYLQLALQNGRPRWKQVAASTRKDPNITRTDVLEFQVPVPDLVQQRRMTAVHQSFKARVEREGQYLDKIRALKHSLTADLLTGRVRVSDAEKVVKAVM